MSAAAASWWHCGTKAVSRSSGKTAIASIAYRFAERFHDAVLDLTHDYTRKRGVMDRFIVAPEGAPEWAYDPEQLWNAAERAEKRKNSVIYRETELSLPSALTPQERRDISYELAEWISDRYGVAVSVAIHEPSRNGDQRNHHAHLMFTTRELTPEGFGKKTRVLDNMLTTGPQEFKKIQEAGANITNRFLEEAGSDVRVDHRSFAERGIEREPTTHLGPTANAMERRGESSERGDINRVIEQANTELQETAALTRERDALDSAIAERQEALVSPPDSIEEARERMEHQAQPLAESITRNGAIPDIENDGLTWWQRAGMRIAAKARDMALAIWNVKKIFTRRTDRDRGLDL